MRVPAALTILSLCIPAAALPADLPNMRSGASPARHCARTRPHLANGGGLYRGRPLTPRKLAQLPPATAYMAVYRHVAGCEDPLTMADYRKARPR